MGFSGGSLVQWLQNGAPPPRKRSVVVEWPPGWLRETSVVFLLSNLWLPNQGLGTWLGESLACCPRVVGGFCSRTPPSGCPTALGQEGPRQGIFGNPVDIFGGDASVSSLAVSRSSLALLQPWPAPLPVGIVCGKSCMGRSAPYPQKEWVFSYFFI